MASLKWVMVRAEIEKERRALSSADPLQVEVAGESADVRNVHPIQNNNSFKN